MNGTITKRKRKDGSISWGYYYKANGRQVMKTCFPSKAAAADALRVVLGKTIPSQSPDGKSKQVDHRTLEEYLRYWLDSHAALRCSPATLQNYQGLAKYLTRHLGRVRLCDLTAGTIQEFVNRLQLHGGVKTTEHPEGRPLSAKRVHAAASLLYSVLSDAVRLDHLMTNVMADRRVKLPKRQKRQPAVIDPGMIGKLFEVARGCRAYPFIVLAACTGARRGELCSLTWDDIDFTKGTVTVSKSLEQIRHAPLRIKSTKSGETRIVGLDDFGIETLREHREEQGRDRAFFGSDYQDNGLLFCQPDGRYYSPNNIGMRVSELMSKAGLKGFSLHALRHSHASILLSSGTPLQVVSGRLGHANSNITLSTYSHALPADVRAASKAWSNALAEVISEGRKTRAGESLEKSRKKAVNY